MLTKLTLLAAVAQAAPPVPGQGLGGNLASPTNYVNAVTAAYTGAAATSTDPKVYAKNGFACLRQGWAYAYPMQLTSSAVTVVAQATAASADINAFYTTKLSQLGTVSATPAVGDNSGCGTSITDPTKNVSLIASGASAPAENRLFWMSGANYAADTGAAIQLNVDFVLASTYQDSYIGTGTRGTAGANYCDVQITTLDASTTSKDLVTNNGLNGITKCTYFINVSAGKGAPAFTITNLDYWKFQLHYAEWSGVDLGSKFLSTNVFVGTIPTTAANIYPSPIKVAYPTGTGYTAIADLTNAWPTADQNRANWFPNTLQAGDVGGFTYYRNAPGTPFLGQKLTVNSAVLLSHIDATNAEYASFNTRAGEYNTLRTAYNSALSTEKARAADFFKSIFESPTKIPARPCGPSQPAAWMGPQIDWWVTNNAIGSINDTFQGKMYGVFDNYAITTPSLQSGWLAATPDNSITAPVAAPGHTFGVRGQGNATNAVAGSAWANREVAPTASHGMMVSLFPYDMTDTAGIATGKNVTLKAQVVTWRAYLFSAPVQPSAVSAPDSAAAAYLAAGAAAVAAVAATMF